MADTYVEVEPRVHDTCDTATSSKERTAEMAGRARAQVEQVGNNIQGRVDRSRAPAADNLEGAASALHRKADNLPGGETTARWAHRTADSMQATAEYIREHDVRGMMADAKALVRRHPGASLMAAAVVGFLIARAFRSDD